MSSHRGIFLNSFADSTVNTATTSAIDTLSIFEYPWDFGKVMDNIFENVIRAFKTKRRRDYYVKFEYTVAFILPSFLQ